MQAYTISGISQTLNEDVDQNLDVIVYGFAGINRTTNAVDAVKGNPLFPKEEKYLNKLFNEEQT